MSEFLRVFNYKKIIILLCLMLINLGLFSYINIPKSRNGLTEREIYTHEKYLEKYYDNINDVIKNADNLQKFSIFNKKKTFTYSNIIRTADDFKRIAHVDVSNDNSRAVEAFTEYYYSYYISFFFLMIIVYDLFRYRENGMWQITYSTKDGREYLSLTNMIVIAAGGLVTVILMSLSTFAASLVLYGGVKDLNNPIQNITGFDKFTYPISKIQYVLILIGVAAIVTVLMGLLMWTIFVIFRQRNYAVICIAAFIGIEIVLYNNVEVNSTWSFLHFVNIINALKLNEMLKTYLNWGVAEYVFSVSSVVLFAIFVITVVMTGIAYVNSSSMRPYGKITLWDRCVGIVSQGYQHILAKMPQFIKEFHKLVFSGHGVWFIAGVIFVVVYASTNGVMKYTDAESLKDQMYIEHGGQDKEYIKEYTQQRINDVNDALQELENLVAIKDTDEAGTDWNDRYYELNGQYEYAKTKAAFCAEFMDKLLYLDDVKQEYGVDAWIMSERGYTEIVGSGSAMRETTILIALIIAVMFITAENIQLEYVTGMEMILNGSVNGRGNRKLQKYISALIFTVVLTVVVFTIEYIYMYSIYGMPYLQAPALSLKSIYDKLGHGIYSYSFIRNVITSVSIAGYMLLRTVIELVLVITAMNVSILISYISKGKLNRAFQVASVGVMIAITFYVRWKLI